MRTVAVLGAGAGGAAATAELVTAGHSVRLWNRSPETLEPFVAAGGVRYDGVLGRGLAPADLLSPVLAEVIDGADVAVVCLPAIAHEEVATALAALGPTLPIVLNPGHTGGALHVRRVFLDAGAVLPPLSELSTLTYVARKYTPDMVTISGVADRVRVACLPEGDARRRSSKRPVTPALELAPRRSHKTSGARVGEVERSPTRLPPVRLPCA